MSGHPLPERGLGARYVAVRYSAMYYERAAARWRRWAIAGWLAAFVILGMLAVVVYA